MMPNCAIAMTQNLENKRMENHTFHAGMTVPRVLEFWNLMQTGQVFQAACFSLV
jgi:hypothetical protein